MFWNAKLAKWHKYRPIAHRHLVRINVSSKHVYVLSHTVLYWWDGPLEGHSVVSWVQSKRARNLHDNHNQRGTLSRTVPLHDRQKITLSQPAYLIVRQVQSHSPPTWHYKINPTLRAMYRSSTYNETNIHTPKYKYPDITRSNQHYELCSGDLPKTEQIYMLINTKTMYLYITRSNPTLRAMLRRST
jgi:hypothetical protein